MKHIVAIECDKCHDYIEDEYVFEFEGEFYHEDCLEEVVKAKRVEEGTYDEEVSVLDDERIIRWDWDRLVEILWDQE